MIAIDSSAFVRMLDGQIDPVSVATLDALGARVAVLPPMVFTEMLSNPLLLPATVAFISSVPLLWIHDGYWRRAGELRAKFKSREFKAEVPDCLIAQSCIDHQVPLLTYDHDFRHFVSAGLQLA